LASFDWSDIYLLEILNCLLIENKITGLIHDLGKIMAFYGEFDLSTGTKWKFKITI
jgi:hypothetical protein